MQPSAREPRSTGSIHLMSARHRIKDAIRLLVLDHPFFGLLALRLRLMEDATAETMWVDGVTLGYNPAYVGSLNDAELKGLLCHEVLHVAAGHPWRRGERGVSRWNRAADFSINPIVLDAGMVLPGGALVNPAFKGLAAEVIYERLPEPPAGGQDNAGSSNSGNGCDQQEDIPEEAGSDQADPGDAGNAPEQERDQGQEGHGHYGPSGGPTKREPMEPQTSPATTMGEVRDAPEDRAEELEADWKMAVEAAAKAAGHLPGSLTRLIETARKPKVDWREVLRAFVQQSIYSPDYRFSLPNRRFIGMGLYMPRLVGENVRAAVIAVDTSASVTQTMLEQFHGEIRAVLEDVKPERTFVVYADWDIQGVEEVLPEDLFRFEAKGRGGTSFIPVFDWIVQEAIDPDCLIYLTDLEGEMPAAPPEYQVLWVTPPTNIIPRWGQKVEIVE